MSAGLEPADEYLHLAEDDARSSDRLDFYLYDIPVHLGCSFGLDNRPGQGYTQMSACLYLPDGRAAFVSERSGIGGSSVFDAGGLRVEVVRPFQEVYVSYDGKLLLLEEPATTMMHPERWSAGSPVIDAEVRLTFSGISTLYEDVDDRRRAELRSSSGDGHYEQLMSGIGSVRIGDDRWEVDGLGMRAHRWEAPSPPSASYGRRLTANIGPSLGFMAFHTVWPGGRGSRGGFVWDGTALHVCSEVTIRTSWSGVDSLPRSIDLTLKAGDQTWRALGQVVSLLARPDDGADAHNGLPDVTRVCEGLTEWRLGDGQVGYGMSEYVDQIVGGKPAGVAE
jgi:hypothetical protein